MGGSAAGRNASAGCLSLPALVMYGAFVLLPLLLSIQYSFFRWNGIGPMTWVGLKNYLTILQVPDLLGTIFNAFGLVVFFSFIPVTLGLVVASVMHRVAPGRLGRRPGPSCSCPRSSRSSRPASSGAGCWRSPASSTRSSGASVSARLPGPGSATSAGPSRPSGLIGIWVLLGFCTVLLATAMTKIDPSLYESAGIDGAGWFSEFRRITVPLLRNEIGVCLTVTVIAALAAFDIVYVTTAGGPGNSTAVPGIQIYILAFTEQRIGLASALAVMLMILVLLVILPIQRLSRESASMKVGRGERLPGRQSSWR